MDSRVEYGPNGLLQLVRVCNHCGNHTTQKMLYWCRFGPVNNQIEFRLVQCESCEEMSLYKVFDLDADIFGAVLYPCSKELSMAVPEKIRHAYNKAIHIFKLDPESFCVRIRGALELVCKDKGIKGKNLEAKVKEMANVGLVPSLLAQMAESIRSLGSIGAHKPNIKLTQKDAEVMNDFFNAILEYVYIAPDKVESFKKHLKEIKK